MLTVSELVDLAAEVRVEDFSVLRMISRRLIDAETLPKAVGARIPHVTHEQTASFLLAVATTWSVYRDAPRNALTYGGLVKEGMAGGQTALEGLVDLLRTLPTELTPTDWFMEVCQTFPQVVIKNHELHGQYPSHSERTDYGDFYIPEGEDRAGWPADAGMKLFRLSGSCLYVIARALAADE
jgi:hypothetical protein